jgi:hypothetical protein
MGSTVYKRTTSVPRGDIGRVSSDSLAVSVHRDEKTELFCSLQASAPGAHVNCRMVPCPYTFLKQREGAPHLAISPVFSGAQYSLAVSVAALSGRGRRSSLRRKRFPAQKPRARCSILIRHPASPVSLCSGNEEPRRYSFIAKCGFPLRRGRRWKPCCDCVVMLFVIGHEGAERLVLHDGPALKGSSLCWFDASSGASPVSSKRSILLLEPAESST